MDPSLTTNVLQEGIGVAIRLSGPILLLCMLVGVVIAILQAVTQIHEQSIGFILKAITVILILLIGGQWMLETLQEFTYKMFDLML